MKEDEQTKQKCESRGDIGDQSEYRVDKMDGNKCGTFTRTACILLSHT